MKSQFKSCLEMLRYMSLRSKIRHTDSLFDKNAEFVFGRPEVAQNISRRLTDSGVHHKVKGETIIVSENVAIREVVIIEDEDNVY